MIVCRRLVVTTSKPAPLIWPLLNACFSAASSTRPPRAVLIRSGRLSICANSAVEIMLRVEGIKRERKVMMSLTSRTFSNGVQSGPIPLVPL